jgi:hypothetical protein
MRGVDTTLTRVGAALVLARTGMGIRGNETHFWATVTDEQGRTFTSRASRSLYAALLNAENQKESANV